MTDEQNFHRVAEEFHNTIVNSDMDRMGVLLAFTQSWVSCNAQMDMADYGSINEKEFTKETKNLLKECRELVLENLPEVLEEIKTFKQQH